MNHRREASQGNSTQTTASSPEQNGIDATLAQNGTGATADYDYSFEGNEITITQYKGSGGDVVIPATIDGKKVTKIGYEAFYMGVSDDRITSVTIPNGVTEIGCCAFRFNYGLISIAIPESVVKIGDLAFDSTRISSVYFEGNAPYFDGETPYGTGFSYVGAAIIYYKPGTTGWDDYPWIDFTKEPW